MTQLIQLDGLAAMRAIADGSIAPPPIALTLGFDLAVVGEGHAVFTCVPGAEHQNPLGTVHGGLAATLLDSATGCAVHTTLPAGVGYGTTDLHVTFLRPISADTGALTCTGTVLHRGRRMATAEGRLTDADGRLLATGTATCMLFDL